MNENKDFVNEVTDEELVETFNEETEETYEDSEYEETEPIPCCEETEEESGALPAALIGGAVVAAAIGVGALVRKIIKGRRSDDVLDKDDEEVEGAEEVNIEDVTDKEEPKKDEKTEADED